MPTPGKVPSTGSTRRVQKTFSHIAAPDDIAGGGVSFLDLLLKRFPYHTTEEWTARIRDGRVTLEGAAGTPEQPVTRGMRLEYRVEDYEEPAVPIDFHEITAIGDVALVHKPSGLPVHKTGKVFVHVLANLYRSFKQDEAWSPLNRLDVETSGIVAFARGREALRRFAPTAPGMVWTKAYLAVVHGVMTQETRHDGPLAEVPPGPEHPIRSRMWVHPEGKAASTLFQPLLTSGNKTLVIARPVTGRKHQIRTHLVDLGFPIVGDKVYAHDGYYYLKRLEGELTDEDIGRLGSPRQLLHAVSLEIRAEDGTGIAANDFDLPEDFRRYFPEADESLLRNALGMEFPRA